MNPFHMVYTALWDMMVARTDFPTFVLPGNRIRFDNADNRDPLKRNVTTNDLPEVMLASEGIVDINLCDSSSGTKISRTYSWYISTGDYRLEDLYNVEWAIFTGMLDWQTVLTALQWCGKPFVKHVNFVDITNGFADIEQNRGIEGWSAIWSCFVEMHFVTRELRDGCP